MLDAGLAYSNSAHLCRDQPRGGRAEARAPVALVRSAICTLGLLCGTIREELFKQSPDKIDLYEASLEGSRFQQPDEQGPIVDYLVALFGTRKLDLIVTIGAPATFFVQRYRPKLFPSTPLI